MRAAFVILSIASPLYLATYSPVFAASIRYSPRPAPLILDFAIFTSFGRSLGLGRYLSLFGRFEVVLVSVPAALVSWCWLMFECLSDAVILRVLLRM